MSATKEPSSDPKPKNQTMVVRGLLEHASIQVNVELRCHGPILALLDELARARRAPVEKPKIRFVAGEKIAPAPAPAQKRRRGE